MQEGTNQADPLKQDTPGSSVISSVETEAKTKLMEAIRPSKPASHKLLISVFSLITISSLAVASVAVIMQRKEAARRQTKERELTLSQAENRTLKVQVDEFQQAKVQLEDELVQARIHLTAVQEEVAKVNETRQSLSHAVEERQQEVIRLSSELQQVQEARQQIEKQLASLTTEHQATQRQLKDFEQAKTALEAKVLELSQQAPVELDRVLVTGQAESDPSAGASSQASAKTSSGQVIVVNKEYDFIVMNLGRNQGISIGQEFRVIRDNEILGQVKVEKLYDELSAATILPNSKKDSIQEGDQVSAL